MITGLLIGGLFVWAAGATLFWIGSHFLRQDQAKALVKEIEAVLKIDVKAHTEIAKAFNDGKKVACEHLMAFVKGQD